MNVTALPLIVVQIVSGSEPTFSVVKPWLLVTVPGTVTGIGFAQVLPVVLTETPVMACAVGSTKYVSWGAQASLAIRFANEAPIY